MSYENPMMLLAQMNVTRVKNLTKYTNITDIEFKVFSQWGEDGIIQYLINKLPIKNKSFIEFGVQDYRESNTRFLLKNNNWTGLVLDSSKKCIDFIKSDGVYWQHDLIAHQTFITKDNINETIKKSIGENVDLLSIDIDGNDYWIWKSINIINPMIVICEYNSIFGNKAKITIPYKEDFYRTNAHYSNLYFGASLPALKELAEEKGYQFFGCTTAGNDAFFIRSDVAYLVKEEIALGSYVYSKAKESRNQEGKLTFLRDMQRIEEIKNMQVLNLDNEKIVTIESLLENGEIIYV